MMRVVMLSKACYVAAYRRKLELLGAESDIDLTLIVPPYWQFAGRREPLERGFEANYRMVVLNPVFNGRHHLHFYPGLRTQLARLQPDLVHIDEEPYDVVTWHALGAARAVGACAVFFTWQNLDLPLPPPFRLIRRRVLAAAAGGIAGNADGAALLGRLGFPRPLAIIPQFGVDDAVYRPGPERRDTTFLVGYAGRLVAEKGVMDLLDACLALEGDWRLRYIGVGPMMPALAAAARRAGVTERVEFAGAVPSTAMPAALQQLDCLALPSRSTPRWKEQFGRVLVEAMACAVPVIGSDCGEIPNVVGEAGLVVPEGDVQALAGALQRLHDDPALRRELGSAGRQRVAERFTQARIAAATAAFYRRILTA